MPSADCVHRATISALPLGSLQLLTPDGAQLIYKPQGQVQQLPKPNQVCLKPDGSLTYHAGSSALWSIPPSLPGAAPYTALVYDCELQVGSTQTPCGDCLGR